jgi:hypothetical protein
MDATMLVWNTNIRNNETHYEGISYRSSEVSSRVVRSGRVSDGLTRIQSGMLVVTIYSWKLEPPVMTNLFFNIDTPLLAYQSSICFGQSGKLMLPGFALVEAALLEACVGTGQGNKKTCD